ncbi:hypothetical protein [Neorhizobium petrolearium]|jgi:hypothetical protein|uniref:hypothetical protein n=1 Tax=Neorhizobium petrolearium TaxID=515361 RepID=UPI003F1625D4
MEGTPKTLEEMNLRERFHMFETVASALEDAAEAAGDLGDARFAVNSKCVAGMIRGMRNDLGEQDLKPAELLLKHGVMLLHLYSTRSDRPEILH